MAKKKKAVAAKKVKAKRCAAKTREGKQCKKKASGKGKFCATHSKK